MPAVPVIIKEHRRQSVMVKIMVPTTVSFLNTMTF
jgi:hypothetical protein